MKKLESLPALISTVPTHHPHWFWLLPVFLIRGTNVYGRGWWLTAFEEVTFKLRPRGDQDTSTMQLVYF